MRKVIVFIIAAVLGTVALVGCGGDDDTASTDAGGSTVVAVEMGEFFVTPDQTSVSAGEVTFEVTNVGEIEHEFIIFKTDEDPGSLPTEGDRVVEDEAALIDEIEDSDLQPGSSATLTVTLAAGNYVLFCNLPGHYAQGQYVGFTVS